MILADILLQLDEETSEYVRDEVEKSLFLIIQALESPDPQLNLTLMKECSNIRSLINLARELHERLDASKPSDEDNFD